MLAVIYQCSHVSPICDMLKTAAHAAAHHVMIKRGVLFFSLASVYGQVCVCLHAPHTVLQVIISRQFRHLPHLLLIGKLSNVFPEQELLQVR